MANRVKRLIFQLIKDIKFVMCLMTFRQRVGWGSGEDDMWVRIKGGRT